MKGACFCGLIQFEISGDTPDLYQCHCSECRKTTGSFANAGFILSDTQLHWVSGESNIKTFVKDSGYRVNFCNNCGSPVPNSTILKNKVWIPSGLLEESAKVNALKVANHIFVASKMPSEEIGGAGEQHQTLPDNIESLLC